MYEQHLVKGTTVYRANSLPKNVCNFDKDTSDLWMPNTLNIKLW